MPSSGTWARPPRSTSERLVRGGRSRQRERRHLLLPALIALQEEVGWISPGATNHVGRQLAVPPAEIYGVATFYELLRTTEPDGDGPTTWVCVDPACRITPDVAPVADGTVRHDAPCLGRCEQAPAAFVQRRGPAKAAPEPVPFTLPQAGDTDLRLLRRIGRVDPTSLDSYLAHGGGEALDRARALGPDAVIAGLTDAGLSGRGGAAFPTGVKWRAVRDAAGERKHVVVNGDESEPGTFKDRTLLEHDPFALVEATVIAAETVGAGEAWVYVRGEYPEASGRVEAAIAQVDAAGWLRDGLRIEVRRGGGAYICGEETALFNSIEGFRGEPRNKPPFPTTNGLFDQPTAINNPETLLNVLPILLDGPEAYRSVGTEQSPGTRLFCLSGRIGRPGVYEVPVRRHVGGPARPRRRRRGRAGRRPPRRRGRDVRRARLPRPGAHPGRHASGGGHPRLGGGDGLRHDGRPDRCRRAHRRVLSQRVLWPVRALPGRYGARPRDDGADAGAWRLGRRTAAAPG